MESLSSASDRLTLCLEKAEADLRAVAHRLEEEFNQRYLGKRANPLSVLLRLQKLQREVPEVAEECSALQRVRQDIMSRAQEAMSANVGLLQHLQGRAGLPLSDVNNSALCEGSAGQAASKRSGRQAGRALLITAAVSLEVEPAPNNARRLYAGVNIAAPVQVVWDALTDYDGLGNFIPGLAENKCLVRRPNGAQLMQVGEQEIALGAKFRARIVLEVEEFWSGLPSRSNGNGASSSGRREEDTHIEPRSPLAAQPHDLTFTSIEGDFQVFKGVWRMQESDGSGQHSRLSYCLFVRPQIWLPVRLVQGRVEKEIKSNLLAVQRHAERMHALQHARN